jgi:hypothetical protein
MSNLEWFKWPLLVVLAVMVLGAVSYVTSETYGDGGFPYGEFHVLVVDESETPVPGVSLRVSRTSSGQPAGDYPLKEATQPAGMVSGDDGIIVCHQPRDGIQFGGSFRMLFWIIQIGSIESPQYTFTFAKNGFQSKDLTADEFFALEGQTIDKAPRLTTTSVRGTTTEMPVWKLKVVLKRSN